MAATIKWLSISCRFQDQMGLARLVALAQSRLEPALRAKHHLEVRCRIPACARGNELYCAGLTEEFCISRQINAVVPACPRHHLAVRDPTPQLRRNDRLRPCRVTRFVSLDPSCPGFPIGGASSTRDLRISRPSV